MREHAYARMAKSSMLISVIAILRDRLLMFWLLVTHAGSHVPASGLPYASQRVSICRPAGSHVPASELPCACQRVSMCRPAKIYVRRVVAHQCPSMKKRTHFTVGPFELKLTHVSS